MKEWVVGITDYIISPANIEQEAFPEAEFRFLPDWRASEKNQEAWRQVEALLVWHWETNRATVGLLDRCRIVVRYGVGFDEIDVQALAERRIPLCNTPDYGTEEVADAACAMILALQRKTVAYDRSCRGYEEGWQENLLRPIQRTSSRTLGVIGVGRIGTAVVNRMKPFGYRIGYKRAHSLEELLSQADVITIHCPLTAETRGMVDGEFLGMMEPGSSLVNTARGGILADLDCLEEALHSGHLASAAMDVLPDEPPKAHPLIQAWQQDAPWLRGRLLINPHVAYYSEQAWYEMRFKAAETARMYLVTGKLRNHIEP
jgi:phosphoglycerate dehydrogenase-like enzyme